MSERDPEASDVEEGVRGGEQMLMANQPTAELTKQDIGLLHDPSPPVAPRFAPILIASGLRSNVKNNVRAAPAVDDVVAAIRGLEQRLNSLSAENLE